MAQFSEGGRAGDVGQRAGPKATSKIKEGEEGGEKNTRGAKEKRTGRDGASRSGEGLRSGGSKAGTVGVVSYLKREEWGTS